MVKARKALIYLQAQRASRRARDQPWEAFGEDLARASGVVTEELPNADAAIDRHATRCIWLALHRDE